ncbi:hypothetical protein ACFYW6_40485 [Streptomyces sp. NPDC002659]|uniref:hypothetical protein n=1 Tax=Streptomyces sp. NPDC002659 TaxID=3364656 RepID=UPI00367D3323
MDATAGTWPLVYTLDMIARSGRWEVTTLEAGAPAKTIAAKGHTEPSNSTTAGGGQ